MSIYDSKYVPYVPNIGFFKNKPTEPDYEPAPIINVQILDDNNEWIHIHRIKNHLTIEPTHNSMFQSNWNKNDTVQTFRNKMEQLGLHIPYLGIYQFKLPCGHHYDEHQDGNIETIIHSVPWKDRRLYYVVLDYTML